MERSTEKKGRGRTSELFRPDELPGGTSNGHENTEGVCREYGKGGSFKDVKTALDRRGNF